MCGHLVEVARAMRVQQLGCQPGMQPFGLLGAAVIFKAPEPSQHTDYVGVHDSDGLICSYGCYSVPGVRPHPCTKVVLGSCLPICMCNMHCALQHATALMSRQ